MNSKADRNEMKEESGKSAEVNPDILRSLPGLDVEMLAHEIGTNRVGLEMRDEELLRASRELEESRQRYSDLFEDAPVGYFTLDSMDRITGVNWRGVELLRQKKARLLGKPLAAFVHPGDSEAYRLHRQDTSFMQECEVRLEVGEEVLFVRIQSVRDQEEKSGGQGDPACTLTAITDVTAIRRAEAERDEARARERAAREEAEEKEQGRLESLRALAGGVSHDLNNLLVIIGVNTELALAKAEDPAIKELIEGIDHAARRIGTIAKQMLTYSGGMELSKEPLDLSKSVYETAHLLSVTLSRKGSLRFNLAEGLPPIEADRSAIQQIVVNLLLNAADAVEGYRGTILISTGSIYADRQYLDGTSLGKELPQGRYEYFEVLDDGTGMSKATLEKLFEPFYTTKFTGRGMGLASVFGIVREHGGAIEVESAPRKGTRIRVLMPQPEQPRYLPEKDEKKREAHPGSGTILLVDDEEDVLNMTEKVLKLNGYNVITADDGPGAIDAFKSRSGAISAVVIDLIMPDMPGDETSREIRKISQGVPIVLLSGYHEIDAAAMKEKFGVTAVIKKPYRIDAFLKTLQGIMETPR